VDAQAGVSRLAEQRCFYVEDCQSAFLTRMNRHIGLTDSERDALLRLGGQAVALSKRDRLFS
jgi:hypothetical protein